MSLLGTFLLVHVFTAVLPPKDADDENEEYYHILGLEESRRTSAEDIKKAYRQLSLELHPDKIAQRGGTDADAQEAAERYEKVQQAYAVLSDREERAKYHSVNCSPERYKFVYQQGWMHPISLMDNVSRASCWDKSRLVMLIAVFLLLLLLQPILIAIKINSDLGNSETALEEVGWNVVLIPFWVLYGGYALLLFLVFLWSKRRDLLLDFLQHICIFVGSGLVVRQWDNAEERPMKDAAWYRIATPFYLAVLFKAASLSERVRSLNKVLEKLVSPDYMDNIQRDAQERNPDMTIEQMEALRSLFVVVTPDDLQVAANLAVIEATGETLRDDELEALKVQTSPEYDHLQKQINRASLRILQVLVYPIIFISLVAAKLEGKINATWWIVFVPIWVFFGLQISQSCCTCFCVTTGLSDPVDEDDGDDTENENDEENGEGNAAEGVDQATENETQPDQENQEETPETQILKGDETKTENDQETGDDEQETQNPTAVETQPDGDESPRQTDDTPDANQSEGDPPDHGVDDVEEEDDKLTDLREDVIGEGASAGVDPLTPAFPSSRSEFAAAAAPTDSTKLFEPATSNTFFSKAKAQEDAEKREAEAERKRQREEYEENGGIPELDEEEAFRQWQRAHAQDEDNAAMEAQLRAQWTCCTSTLELITICLVVAKLEDSFGGEEGFNAFIVLIPAFFVAGLVLCCCCCLVYTAPDMSKMEEFMAQQAGPAPHGEGGDEEEAIPMPMPAPEPPTDDEDAPTPQSEDEKPAEQPTDTSNNEDNKETTPDVENGGALEQTTDDINDLD